MQLREVSGAISQGDGAQGTSGNNEGGSVKIGEGGASSAGWHKLQSGLRCQKEFQLEHVRGIHKPQVQTPDYFAIGIGVHAGRATWFGNKFRTDTATWEKVKHAVRRDFEKQKLPVTVKAESACLSYLEQYIAYWSMRPRPTPVAIEWLIGPVPFEPDDPFFMHRTARLDDVSKYPEAGGHLCIGELKTTSGGIQDVVNEYTLHGQPLMQWTLFKRSKRGEKKFGPVKHVMLDVIKKGYGSEKCQFHRQPIPITDYSLAWYSRDLRAQLKILSGIDWNTDTPRNIAQCTRVVGRARVNCPYLDLCRWGKSAGTQYRLADGGFMNSWRPSEEQLVPPWK